MESEAAAERELQLLREQELSNLLHQKDYVRAVGVAITLDQPNRILKILQGACCHWTTTPSGGCVLSTLSTSVMLAAEILEKEESGEALRQIIESLREDQLSELGKS